MLSGLLKFILGILLAIAVLLTSGVAVALYFLNRTAIPPTKPVFANDNPQLKEPNSKTPKAEANSTSKPTSIAADSPSPTPTPTETKEALPKGAYQARISWSEGISLRAEPTQDAERVGGVGFNEKVVVLEESQDKVWKKIRVEGTEKEGWTKVGNIEKVDDSQ